MIAVVDDDIYEELSKHSWYLNGHRYPRTTIRDADGIWRGKLMSRLIMGAKSGEMVDHIDGDTLNNQRKNLRLCTNSQNTANHQFATHSESGFWGVAKNGSGWQARIRANNCLVCLGTYSTPEEAARVRDTAVIKYFGRFAPLNFGNELVSLKEPP